MEIKATLLKPFTHQEKLDFIKANKGYEIRENDEELQAWGLTAEEEEEEIAQKEYERLQKLFMTRSDFFDGMIMAFDLGQTELRAIIENILNSINITPIQIKIALNNYDNALNFYRKHTLFSLINNVPIPISETVTLIFTNEIWDKFFDTKDYGELQKAIHIEEVNES